jgi:spore maturation protein CgeB
VTLNIVVLGLSITSSWGNGHATTYRALIKAMAARGHRITFLERDRPWYRGNRDLSAASYCRIELYNTLADVPARFGKAIMDADLVILGSFVPDGTALADWITTNARGVTAFYDIDTPVTLARLAENEVDYISGAMIPRFDIYLSFTGGPVLDLIEESYGSPRARALYCAVDPEFHAPVAVPSRWTLGYLGTYSEDRQAGLARLLLDPAQERRSEQFVVAGPQYPDDIEWPDNVERIEHLPPTEHPGFFCAQRYTLNVTRSDMAAAGYSPSVRLFEAAACGVPVISDPWPGVETILLPDREILLARNSADVLRILNEVPEDRRRAIGEAARDRILRNHTAHHRAKQLEEYYAEVIAEPLLKEKIGTLAGATRRTGRTSER